MGLEFKGLGFRVPDLREIRIYRVRAPGSGVQDSRSRGVGLVLRAKAMAPKAMSLLVLRLLDFQG